MTIHTDSRIMMSHNLWDIIMSHKLISETRFSVTQPDGFIKRVSVYKIQGILDYAL